MQIVASLLAFIVFVAVMWAAEAFALAGDWREEGWAYGALVVIAITPVGYPVLVVLSHVAFKRRRLQAAACFGALLLVGGVLVNSAGIASFSGPVVLLGPLLLGTYAPPQVSRRMR